MKKIVLCILLLFFPVFKGFAVQQYAIMTGTINQIETGDSVTLLVSKYGNLLNEQFGYKIYKSAIEDHRYYFKIRMESFPLCAEIRFGSKHLIKPLTACIIENGDRVNVKTDSSGIIFSGAGSEKFSTIYHLSKIYANDFKGVGNDLACPAGLGNIYRRINLTGLHQLTYLNTQRKVLSNTAYTLIKSQILGMIYGSVGNIYYFNYSALNDSLQKIALNSIKNSRQVMPQELLNNPIYLKSDLLKFAGYFSSSIISKYELDSCYLMRKPFSVDACYHFIINHYSGAFRDRIVTDLLFTNSQSSQNISACLNSALGYIKNEDFLKLLNKISKSRIIGATAFNFTLTDTLGKFHQLSDFKGNVVLIDFWYSGCGNCIKISPYLKNLEESLLGKKVVFLSVCVDKDKKKWIESINSGKYASGYVINLFTNGIGLKHPICLHYDIISYPTLILVDKYGKMLQNPMDPRTDNGVNLKELITSAIGK